MKKDKLNTRLREYAKSLSPKDDEKDLMSKVYNAVNNVLWINNCIQIWSYPRYTSITPVHDLDVLYILWEWNENSHNPLNTLIDLNNKLISDFDNPTKYSIKISQQTHSVTISFQENNEEKFWLDIVPAYIFNKNEFWLDKYKVPEIINISHKNRIKKYKKLTESHEEMWWINSDPRWYIKIASELDSATRWEFRKSVKLIKNWKNNLCNSDENLKLKSFHLEQVITNFFRENNDLEIFDAVFNFFIELPNIIARPNQISDRANSDKYIDDYLVKLTQQQKNKIILARDCLLIKLENISSNDNIRVWPEEKFLFDQKIPVCTDSNYSFKICGNVHQRDWFRAFVLDVLWIISIDRKITFWIEWNQPNVDLFKWKVRNDSNCDSPRGEITDHRTLREPEHTKYWWNHYVECYAILNNVCVAKEKQNVKLNK